MKFARATRVGFIWAMCLQLLAAPWAMAIEAVEHQYSSDITSVNTEKNDEVLPDDSLSNIINTTHDENLTTSKNSDVKLTTTTLFADNDESENSDTEHYQYSGVVVTQVQTSGGSGFAAEELIELRNNSDKDVDITDWELYAQSSRVLKIQAAETTVGYRAVLPAGATMLLASPAFVAKHSSEEKRFMVDIELPNDKITNANGSVRLYDAAGSYVSGVAWGTGAIADGVPLVALPSSTGGIIERLLLDSGWHQDTRDNKTDFRTVSVLRENYVTGMVQDVFDSCLNIAGIQNDIPEGWYRDNASGNCSDTPPPPPLTLNLCGGIVLSEIGANVTDQFIELHNPGDEVVELGGCRLLTNRSITKYFQFGAEELAAGEYRAVMIPAEADLTLTKTTSGTVYLVAEDGVSEVDSVSYANLRADTSWALVAGEWYQTYVLTPGEPNVYEQYLPCDAGYVRNVETGRCNVIVLASEPAPCAPNQYRNPDTGRCRLIDTGSTLAPCREGQYRHPETNRCRNLSTTASTLVPCREGQERNPETNRCRNIAAAASTLVPCREGQERNPATNRCRNVLAASTLGDSDFPVEPVDNSQAQFAAWWAVGVVVMLGAAYGIWEWRGELGRVFGRLRFVRLGSK